MKLTLNWLQKYVPHFAIDDVEKVKHRIDTRLSEVEKIERRGEGLSKLVVGQIVEVNPHPSNDKLTVCKVDVGQASTLQIVCGAPNARKDLKSVVCLAGGKVYDPQSPGELMEIDKRKMGSVESQGMLCAPDELGLSDNHTQIIEIDPSTPVGSPVTELFQDTVIEIENKALPHRPDTFSHHGIAREVSAIFKLKIEDTPADLPNKRADELRPVSVKNNAGELCKRYSGISIKDVQVGPSPLWLQVALSYAGVKPINNVVDITNYVMLDTGQPLHAFDIDKLNGSEIVVRKAKEGEEIETIDHEKRSLPTGSLVIADEKKAIGIAGIMGGLTSEIGEGTKNIFIESANFDMYSIRRTSRQLGLRSEASTRFEKGIDPNTTIQAIKKATTMIVDICGGEIASEIVDVYPEPESQQVIKFDLGSVKRLLGAEIEKATILDLLGSLGFEVLGAEKISPESLFRKDVNASVEVRVPSWRRDVDAQEDILEEIGRLYGYEHISPTLPKRDLRAPKVNSQKQLTHSIKETLSQAGLYEVYTYSMIGKELYEMALLEGNKLLAIENPISPDLAYVRDQILPSLLANVRQNLAKHDNFGLFEIGRVAKARVGDDGQREQPHHLAAVRAGQDEQLTLRQLKYSIEALNNSLFDGKLRVTAPGKFLPAYLHPGKAGSVVFDGRTIGHIGELHPLVLENFDLNTTTIGAYEIVVESLLDFKPETSRYTHISSYQAAQRDISFWQKEGTYISELIDAIESAEVSLLDNYEVVDTFKQENKASITLRLTLQAPDHTLTQEEITSAVKKVEDIIRKQGHKIR